MKRRNVFIVVEQKLSSVICSGECRGMGLKEEGDWRFSDVKWAHLLSLSDCFVVMLVVILTLLRLCLYSI